MDDQIIKWARDHKKRIAKEYLSKYGYLGSDTPHAIFMAGLPGAGKTEFAKRLIPQLVVPPLHIDMDEIAEHIENYKPRIAHLFRAGATVILKRLYDQAIHRRIEILVDGTFSRDKSIKNIQRAIDHGYTVRIYFISPDPITAWGKTQEREVVENRSIDAEGFVNSYYSMLNNLQRVEELFSDKVPISIVLKDSKNQLRDIVENISSKKEYFEPILTRDELMSKIKAWK